MNLKEHSGKLTLIALCIVGLLLLYFSKNISDSVAPLFSETEDSDSFGPVVSSDYALKGNILRRKKGQRDFEKLKAKSSIYHLDTLIVEKDSGITLLFSSGYKIKIKPQSQVILEYWDPEDTSTPIYINFSQGNFELVKQGILGQVYVVQNQNIFIPSRRPKRATRILKISSKTPAFPQAPSTTEKPEPPVAESTVPTTQTKVTEPTPKAPAPEQPSAPSQHPVAQPEPVKTPQPIEPPQQPEVKPQPAQSIAEPEPLEPTQPSLEPEPTKIPQSVTATEEPPRKEEEPPTDASTPTKTETTPDANPSVKKERITLSEEEISQVISLSSALFQKCQTKSLREILPSKGNLLISIKILPSGKVDNAFLIQSDIDNEELAKCTVSVFKRMNFKVFDGEPIESSVPIKYE